MTLKKWTYAFLALALVLSLTSVVIADNEPMEPWETTPGCSDFPDSAANSSNGMNYCMGSGGTCWVCWNSNNETCSSNNQQCTP